jgi:hypothetical protein
MNGIEEFANIVEDPVTMFIMLLAVGIVVFAGPYVTEYLSVRDVTRFERTRSTKTHAKRWSGSKKNTPKDTKR